MRAIPPIFAPVVFTAFPAGACKAGGLGQTFASDHETATHKLSALKPSPAANWHKGGEGLWPGRIYQPWLPETETGDASGTGTTILATRIDESNPRNHAETVKRGLVLNTRDRMVEKLRLNEVGQLLPG